MSWLRNKIQNASITTSMIYVAAVPLLMTVIMSFWLVLPKINQASVYGEMAEEIRLAQFLSNLLHEQQIERGASAVFLGSGGEKFGDELKAQRENTTERRAIVLAAMPSYQAFLEEKPNLAALSKEVGVFLTNLARMDGIRAQIDAQDITVAESVAYYTTLNGQMIHIIKSMTKLSNDSQITSSSTAAVR